MRLRQAPYDGRWDAELQESELASQDRNKSESTILLVTQTSHQPGHRKDAGEGKDDVHSDGETGDNAESQAKAFYAFMRVTDASGGTSSPAATEAPETAQVYCTAWS